MKKINRNLLRDLILDGITEEELKKYDYSHIVDMSNLFNNTKIKSVPLFDTSNVTDMSAMFSNCYNLESVPLFDTSRLQFAFSMLYRCKNLMTIEIDHSLINFEETNSPYLKEKYPEYYI